MISVVILTFNSEKSLPRTLSRARLVSDDIHIVDSFSSDRTIGIADEYGCHVVQHEFETYGAQRNWAIDNLALSHPWQLHLDADEEMTLELVDSIKAINFATTQANGYIIGRKIVFLGQVLRFGGIAKTWHYRLFRRNCGRCEDRLYDQHFVGVCKIGIIHAFLLDHQQDDLSEWTARHNRWADLEARQLTDRRPSAGSRINGRLTGNKIERTRACKAAYYRLPLFARSFGYFLYRYVGLLGFLDGRRGLIYHVLQAFWFRFLVDAKIFERQGRSADD